MYDKVMVNFKEEAPMYKEKLEMLTGGACPSILPISIVKRGESLTCFYMTKGYKRLSQSGELSAQQVLTVVENTLRAMEECSQYLIFPEEFLLNLDTVYVKENLGEVRFTYVPDRTRRGGGKKLVSLIESLKGITTENGGLYLDMLRQLFSVESLSTIKATKLIAQLKREVKMCNIS